MPDGYVPPSRVVRGRPHLRNFYPSFAYSKSSLGDGRHDRCSGANYEPLLSPERVRFKTGKCTNNPLGLVLGSRHQATGKTFPHPALEG